MIYWNVAFGHVFMARNECMLDRDTPYRVYPIYIFAFLHFCIFAFVASYSWVSAAARLQVPNFSGGYRDQISNTSA